MKDSFRTVVTPVSFPEKLSYQTPAFFLGSCFTMSIGGKMKRLKFPVMVNPSGVLYNPLSIEKTLVRLMEGTPYGKEELLHENGRWFSLKHDTFFSEKDPGMCLEKMNRAFEKATGFIRKSHFLFLTFGTAWVYTWKESGEVVANCHKLPAARFERKMLEVNDIVEPYKVLIKRLFAYKDDLKIVFTVSPVRHWKDGPAGNQYSKSVLHVAIHKLLAEDERLYYFPSYEIVMDDLRDYRFYARDMLHLSDVAVDYIWDKFTDAIVDSETFPVMEEVARIVRATEHHPFRPDSEEYRKFCESQLEKIRDLENRYPFLDMSEERAYLKIYNT